MDPERFALFEALGKVICAAGDVQKQAGKLRTILANAQPGIRMQDEVAVTAEVQAFSLELQKLGDRVVEIDTESRSVAGIHTTIQGQR